MSYIYYQTLASQKARCEEIERKLANDDRLSSPERAALMAEKSALYDKLYPEIEEDDE